MTAFAESVVEQATLGWLAELGYAVLHGPAIAYGELSVERTDPGYRDVVLEGRLRQALVRLNPDLPTVAVEDAFRKLTRVDAPTLLRESDFLSIHLPLTPQTRGLIDAGVIGAMRPGALLVNASRGAIVDTAAMTAAVLAGRIRVALDVTDPEPLPEGHPLWSAPGAIVTPHVASDVSGEDDRAWDLAVAQVGRFARGEPLLNIVADGY